MRATVRIVWLAAIGLVYSASGAATGSASDPLCAAEVPGCSAPTGSGAIQMRRIQLIPSPAAAILSCPRGFDLDHDSRAEFIISVQDYTHTEFYESIGDDTFALAHVIAADPGENFRVPRGVADIDADGLSDVVMEVAVAIGGGNSEKYTRVYESGSPGSYPTELAWEIAHGTGVGARGGLILDADSDGKLDIVIEDANGASPEALAVYENDGDDSYVETFFELLPDGFSYSHGIADDLDGDGSPEILFGRAIAEGSSVIAYESTGDNTYDLSWIEVIVPWVNLRFIVDAGDLDGDGRKEFLAGGVTPVPLMAHLYVFEAVADNEFEIVTSIVQPGAPEGSNDAVVADVDGDGRREIVFSTAWTVTIFENTGDNSWSEIWSANWTNDGVGPVEQLGAGDHDGDGKDEIIFPQNGAYADTSVWEIHPAYQADMDGDDRVDVIDNCPAQSNPGQEDADDDMVGDVCDNCVYGFNPAQGAAILGQPIRALDGDTFFWAEPAEIVYVRGGLSLVRNYPIDLTQSVPLGTSFLDSTQPASGEGFYYLARPDCGLGSWQTEVGAQPARDAALP